MIFRDRRLLSLPRSLVATQENALVLASDPRRVPFIIDPANACTAWLKSFLAKVKEGFAAYVRTNILGWLPFQSQFLPKTAAAATLHCNKPAYVHDKAGNISSVNHSVSRRASSRFLEDKPCAELFTISRYHFTFPVSDGNIGLGE